jgi:vancomycin resistance protein VanW
MRKLIAQIPFSMRQQFLNWLRNWRDWHNGDQLVNKINQPINWGEFPYSIHVEQPFFPSESLANKQHNIQLALQRLQGTIIQPGQLFSFWRLVGPPTQRRGFLPGRNIVNGRLSLATGGGLCQLSGIIYHTALIAGCTIVEQHPHTFDLYWENESQRYTPAGTDATVVFGYKDMRFRNNLEVPIQLDFSITPHSLTCFFRTQQPIQSIVLAIERIDMDDTIQVKIKRGEVGSTVMYRKI